MTSTRAYYSGTVAQFLKSGSDAVLGTLTAGSSFPVEATQTSAWIEQIQILKRALANVTGTLYLEFVVPRIGTRIDAALIAGGVVFVIEFKVGESGVNRQGINQTWDYALDLKNFHQASHGSPIIPILVATEATRVSIELGTPHSDGVYQPVVCNSETLPSMIHLGLKLEPKTVVDGVAWGESPYQPTPTIIEAARRLYARHSVESIARNDAGAQNLRHTARCVEEIVTSARSAHRKSIVFVTGVPGAGKTLVGLNLATINRDTNGPTHAVFLSGNGPLVDVLREALTRDGMERANAAPDQDPTQPRKRLRKGEVGQPVKAFIQNVHHFRDEGLRETRPPSDRVVIFDEAQRAWNRDMTADFMKRKKRKPGFSQSEPEFLISYMNRHHDWAVIVCLVGGGQEINRGEAGIGEWFEAIARSFPSWHVHLSPSLTDSEYGAGRSLTTLRDHPHVALDDLLHLSVSMRSFRAEHVSSFVKAVLDQDVAGGARELADLASRYPIMVTRSLDAAKRWIRRQARGSERVGLVASSGAQRLKPHAIDVRAKINPIHWFLGDAEDTRSSNFLEDAATEFQVQGLELDWACVTWDADLRYTDAGWSYRSFVGSRWNQVVQEPRQQYLRNAYRVLLTRARQGMVIFVPPGDENDHTRQPSFYEPTFQYLVNFGIPVLTD